MSWIQTHSGEAFYPLAPNPTHINIHDIAHALSMKCRFGGHCTRFYSVAEHSVIVSRYVAPENALWGLLHDASEAYLADVPRPVKPYLPGYTELEAAVQGAVCARFGLPFEEPEDVRRIDARILTDERRDIMAPMKGDLDWRAMQPALEVAIVGVSPAAAKLRFLDRFHELTVGAPL